MFCTISTEICTNPVISKRTGHIFERSLLEKHLQVTGRCPVTEDEMTMDDVIEVKGYQQPSQPRPPSASSIPALLKTFQNEWDQMMIESYQLKKQNRDLREQLSQRLYQHDAACRVIARLTQERDKALEQLANTQQTMANAIHDANIRQNDEMKQLQKENIQMQQKLKENQALTKQQQQQQENKLEKQKQNARAEMKESQDIDMDSNLNNQNGNNRNTFYSLNGIGSGKNLQDIIDQYPSNLWNATELSQDVKNAITENSTKLSTARRKQKKAKNENLIKSDILSQYGLIKSYSLHSEQDTGISCMDLYPNESNNKYIVTGGYDCRIIISNRETGEFEHILNGHTKKITNVQFHEKYPLILSSSLDKTVRIWRYNNNSNEWKSMKTLNNIHSESITGLQTHSLDCYFGTCSYDGSWSLHSLKGNTLLKKYDNTNDKNNNNNNNNNKKGFSCLSIHPDGNLIGTGSVLNNIVKIWDIRDGNICANFDSHKSYINSVIFNENGYYLSSCDDNGICTIFDLRKIGKQGDRYIIKEFENSKIKTISFDKSGNYLAIGQSYGIEIYQCKKWNKILTLKNHRKDVTSIRFGNNSKFIVSSSRDRKLNVYGLTTLL